MRKLVYKVGEVVTPSYAEAKSLGGKIEGIMVEVKESSATGRYVDFFRSKKKG